MKKTKFSRQQLYDLVWSNSLRSLSKKYNISDNGIRKACTRMNIPLPLMGHWQKVQYGKKVRKRPLPDYDGKETEIELEIRTEENSSPPLKDLTKEIKNDPSLPTTVPGRLSKPDPLIETAQTTLEERSKERWSDHGLINTKSGEVNIQVSPQNYRRALRFMDTFIKLIKARGHSIEVSGRETILIINDERIKINLKEKWNIEKETDERGWVSHNKSPSGILQLRIDELHSKQWKDGKKFKLEEQLARILIEFEKYAEKEKKRKHEIKE
ncbi:MAG: hypothetical protein U5Q03_05450 [Bacteroidota bacterium]|nr:hypothetical protein [Bacteroidota bacterium]